MLSGKAHTNSKPSSSFFNNSADSNITLALCSISVFLEPGIINTLFSLFTSSLSLLCKRSTRGCPKYETLLFSTPLRLKNVFSKGKIGMTRSLYLNRAFVLYSLQAHTCGDM